MKKVITFSVFAAAMFMSLDAKAQNAELGNFCAAVVNHRPEPGTNYDPTGEGVDLNDYPELVPDVVRFPVSVNLESRLSADLPEGTEMETQITEVEIHKDGRVLFGGRDISSNVDALCGELNVVVEEIDGSGQGGSAEDVLNPNRIDPLTGKPMKKKPRRNPVMPENGQGGGDGKPAVENKSVSEGDDIIWNEGY